MVRLFTNQKGWWRHPPCFTGSGGLGAESFIPKLKGFACFLLGVQWGHQGQSEAGPRRPGGNGDSPFPAFGPHPPGPAGCCLGDFLLSGSQPSSSPADKHLCQAPLPGLPTSPLLCRAYEHPAFPQGWESCFLLPTECLFLLTDPVALLLSLIESPAGLWAQPVSLSIA